MIDAAGTSSHSSRRTGSVRGLGAPGITAGLAHPLRKTATDPILVVDDDPFVRALFGRALRRAGHATLEAADGLEALAVLARESVALVLLDATMPRLDGAGVIRALRARPATRTLPIILVTGKADPEDRVEGLASGADDYLSKPVALEELEARVCAQLRSHAAWSEAFEREGAERRAITAALRRVRTNDSPDRAARALLAELRPALGLEALAVASDGPDGSLIPLAVAGSWPENFRTGHPVEADLARILRERTSQGPWIVDLPTHGDEQVPDGRTVVVLPLEGSSDRSLLLALSPVPRRNGAPALARRMPLFLELADLMVTVLHPDLEEGLAQGERGALNDLIAARAFTTYFQPVVTLADGALVGYEALTRFSDGVGPDVRFADATRLGLGHELERATLTAALQEAADLPCGAFLALNVSPTFVLAAPDLPALVSGAGRDIVLEITEHAAVDDYGALRMALARFGPRVQVAVDDAGSGYASLRHILALRPAIVKLDIGWVHSLECDPARQALVAGLVHFAVEAGCRLLGEGVETEAERTTLLRLGVTLGQGYLFGRPAPVLEAAAAGACR